MEWIEATAVCVVILSPLFGAIALLALLRFQLLDETTPEEVETNTKANKIMKKLNWYDVEDLAAAMCDLDPVQAATTEIETALYDKFEVNSEQFVDLMNGLTPLLNAWVSPLTATPYVGFSKGTSALFKTDAPISDFVSGIVSWIKDGNVKDEKASRVITKSGKPVFEITLNPIKA